MTTPPITPAEVAELRAESILLGDAGDPVFRRLLAALESAWAERDKAQAERSSMDHMLNDGVMHFVDKWFDDGDIALDEDPINRAAAAREVALKAIDHADMCARHAVARAEKAEAENEVLRVGIVRTRSECDAVKDAMFQYMAERDTSRADLAATKAKLAESDAIAKSACQGLADTETELAGVEAKLADLVDACDAKDALLACYRVGKRPSEALHERLAKADAAIAAAKAGGTP